MSANATFVSTPAYGAVTPSAADTNRGASAAPSVVYTCPTGGARIERLTITHGGAAAAAASANVLRWWLYDGSVWRLFRELAVATFTPSSTAKGYENVLSFPNGLFLKDTMKIGATVHTYAGTQDAYNFHAEGGEL
jgi:hypothetical protein